MYRVTQTILFIFLVCLAGWGDIAAAQEGNENLIVSEWISYCRTSSENRVPQGEAYDEVSPEVLKSITGKGSGAIWSTFKDGPPASARIILGDEVEIEHGSGIVFNNGAYSTLNTQINSVVFEAK